MRVPALTDGELEQRDRERQERDQAQTLARRLSKAANKATLTVTTLQPMRCHGGWGKCFLVQIWTSGGRLWMEGSHESEESIREALRLYRASLHRRERKADPVRRKAMRIKTSRPRRRG